NDRIKEIIGQLPIRITKSKYFDILAESLSIYKGSDIASVENYIYMLKSSAMLFQPEGMEKEFSDLILLKKELEGADYKNLDHQTYLNLNKQLNKGSDFVRDM